MSFFSSNPSFIRVFYPPAHCYQCHQAIQHRHRWLCDSCYQQLPAPQQPGHYPALERMHSALDSSHIFVGSIYQEPVSTWMRNFKYRGDLKSGRLLLELMTQRLSHDHRQHDLIVPIPMPRWRQVARGFNQCEWLAQQLSRTLQLPICHALKAPHWRRTQAGRGREDRLRAREAFYSLTAAAADLVGKRVILLDDVITTGATVAAASAILSSLHLKQLSCWVLARADSHVQPL